jgi:hypothetical protein
MSNTKLRRTSRARVLLPRPAPRASFPYSPCGRRRIYDSSPTYIRRQDLGRRRDDEGARSRNIRATRDRRLAHPRLMRRLAAQATRIPVNLAMPRGSKTQAGNGQRPVDFNNRYVSRLISKAATTCAHPLERRTIGCSRDEPCAARVDCKIGTTPWTPSAWMIP